MSTSTLANRIKEALDARGMTQAELARMIGIAQPSVNNWVSGESKSMRAEVAVRAAKALGVRVGWLVFGEGDMFERNVEEHLWSASLSGRQRQLEKLIAAIANGKTSLFARVIQRSDALVYQLRSGRRELGDALARHIEICCHLPQGWFDTDDDVPGAQSESRPALREALPVVLDAVAACPQRNELRALLAMLVDHDSTAYRSRLQELLEQTQRNT